ncbi:TPA: hypothetical protein DEP21_00350 [Patescibacteria group bacterium]|nr:hypothetical protein [Candidatus Gracilibacteria bacterium]
MNIHYHQTIEENEDKTYICSNCPSVVQYIKNKHPNHKDKLMPIASPMIIMSRFIKKQF